MNHYAYMNQHLFYIHTYIGRHFPHHRHREDSVFPLLPLEPCIAWDPVEKRTADDAIEDLLLVLARAGLTPFAVHCTWVLREELGIYCGLMGFNGIYP